MGLNRVLESWSVIFKIAGAVLFWVSVIGIVARCCSSFGVYLLYSLILEDFRLVGWQGIF